MTKKEAVHYGIRTPCFKEESAAIIPRLLCYEGSGVVEIIGLDALQAKRKRAFLLCSAETKNNINLRRGRFSSNQMHEYDWKEYGRLDRIADGNAELDLKLAQPCYLKQGRQMLMKKSSRIQC